MTSLIELLSENEKKIRDIVLTEEELNEAILEGKRKKYFHEKNKDYWNESERQDTNIPIVRYGNDSIGS